MDASGDTRTTHEPLASQSAELAALRRMLAISEGTFSFSVAICNSPSVRDYLISKLREESPSIAVVEANTEVADILHFVTASIADAKGSAVFVVGIEKLLPSDQKEHNILRVLNVTRESWQSQFSCPVVFWLPEYAATLLSIHARDLWSWISHTFEFVSEQATADERTVNIYVSDPISVGDAVSAGRLDADQKRLRIDELKLRIAELEQRIEETGVPLRAQLAPHVLSWLHELVRIYIAVGDLEAAEDNIQDILRVANEFGFQTATASAYSNLGLIHRMRGDLNGAEQMYNKSLEIDEKLGRLEGMANQYGSLGVLYRLRGDLDKALQMHLKSLEISKKLGRPEAVMQQYGNLGVIYDVSGDIDRAERMYEKVIDIAEKLEHKETLATVYNNLGSIYLNRGDINMAEQTVRKALEISSDAGMVGLEANQYANLGLISRARGDSGKAIEYWQKALELFKKIGMKLEIEKTQRLIDELDKSRGL